MNSTVERTAAFWDQNYQATIAGQRQNLNFWEVHSALSEQTKIARQNPSAASLGLTTIQLLAEKAPRGTVNTAISIGCGSGHKELAWLKSGYVSHFTLVEIVPSLLNAARESFREAGFEGKAEFVLGGHEAALESKTYDMVYFDNALHHMFDVRGVLAKCVAAITPGGFFVMDDFVGPTYNQFSEKVFRYTDHIRGLLPRSFFEGDDAVPSQIGRVSIEQYKDADPSEAADSGSILPALAELMPGAEIIPAGGLIYYLACRELWHKLTIEPDRDDAIVRLLFELDRVLVRANPDLTCYAYAIWQKPSDLLVPPPKASDWKQLIRWPSWPIPI